MHTTKTTIKASYLGDPSHITAKTLPGTYTVGQTVELTLGKARVIEILKVTTRKTRKVAKFAVRYNRDNKADRSINAYYTEGYYTKRKADKVVSSLIAEGFDAYTSASS